MNTKLTVLAILSLFAATASAAELATWHLWDHALDGKTRCARFSPGKDWTKVGGSYGNSSCSSSKSQTLERKKKILRVMGIYFSARPAK